MKTTKLMTLGLAVICSFVFATSVMAVDTVKKEAAPAKPAAVKAEKVAVKKEAAKEVKAVKPVAKKQQFTGIVTAVDAQANTFTVEKKNKKAAESKTFIAGKDVKIADIAKDSKVEVSYKKDGEKYEAVKVAPAPAKKETAKDIKAEKAEKKAVVAEKKAVKAEKEAKKAKKAEKAEDKAEQK
jgi:hypothetical protein